MSGWRSPWTCPRHPFLTGSAPAVRDFFIRKGRMRARPCARLVVTLTFPPPGGEEVTLLVLDPMKRLWYESIIRVRKSRGPAAAQISWWEDMVTLCLTPWRRCAMRAMSGSGRAGPAAAQISWLGQPAHASDFPTIKANQRSVIFM